MKKMTALLVAVCMLLISMSTSFAMSQKELNDYRWEAQQMLNGVPTVTYSDLKNDPSSYQGKIVKFTAVCKGIDNPTIAFMDDSGNYFAVRNPLPYRFKMEAQYTISATFRDMTDNAEYGPIAVFTYEQTHLPVISEWGL